MINVLIADDEKIEREGLKYLISTETQEHRIFEASNGKQALQILREEDIQLLLTDIKMPQMTGLELSKKAKEEQPDLRSLYSVVSVILHLRRKQYAMALRNTF
ncbi:MAG: response regulator [Eubacteriales bacterium]|nr:response regulator [Eubacteriales bacterium]